MAPRARFELATLRLTAEMMENLSALSGVAYEKLGAIFPSLVAPKPAPTPMTAERVAIWSAIRSVEVADPRSLPRTGLLARVTGLRVSRPTGRITSESPVIQAESSRFRRFEISAITTLQPTGCSRRLSNVGRVGT